MSKLDELKQNYKEKILQEITDKIELINKNFNVKIETVEIDQKELESKYNNFLFPELWIFMYTHDKKETFHYPLDSATLIKMHENGFKTVSKDDLDFLNDIDITYNDSNVTISQKR